MQLRRALLQYHGECALNQVSDAPLDVAAQRTNAQTQPLQCRTVKAFRRDALKEELDALNSFRLVELIKILQTLRVQHICCKEARMWLRRHGQLNSTGPALTRLQILQQVSRRLDRLGAGCDIRYRTNEEVVLV